MPAFPFYAPNEAVFAERLNNFVAKGPGYSAVISVLTPARIAQAQSLLDAAEALAAAIQQTRTYSQQLTAARNRLFFGPEGGPDVNWTAGPDIDPLAAPLPADQFKNLNSLINQIKNDPGYTTAIGEDLGIVPPVAGAPDDNAAQPILRDPVSLPGGHAQFKWTKGQYDAIRVESRRGNSPTWEYLANDLHSPFDDVRPLLVPGEGEDRFYRARYVRGDTPVGQWSMVISLRVSS